MRVLITGGHFSPAYSIISKLRARGHEIIIAGRRHPFEDDKSESLEYHISLDENLEFHEVKTGRFQRKFTAYTITSLLKTPFGFLTSLKILLAARPDIVLTFGGYIGLPICLAARVLKIPIVLHEQTQRAGVASKIISVIASCVCVSFESSAGFFPKEKVVMTGNPVRSEIFEINKQIIVPEGKTIYITGGSTGSHFINSVIYEILSELLRDFVIIHQTGDSRRFGDFEKLAQLQKTLPQGLKKRYILKKFIYPTEIGDVFKSADLIISRAGINAVFEIMASGKMSLLIPIPHGQNNEQLENAKLIKEIGMGDYIEQDDLTPSYLLEKIKEMIKNRKKYEKNKNKAESFIVKDADTRIIKVINETYDSSHH